MKDNEIIFSPRTKLAGILTVSLLPFLMVELFRVQLLEMIKEKDKAKQQVMEKDIQEKTREMDEGLNIISLTLPGGSYEL
jgi:hypothetical protein